MRRTHRFPWSPDLLLSLGPHRRGPRDPTMLLSADEAWRATMTPDGPAALHIRTFGRRVEAEAWGPGAAWTLGSLPRLLGADDRPEEFEPGHPLIASLVRRFPRLRIGSTDDVYGALVPAIIEQKVSSAEAHRSYASLVRRFGTRSPGPARLVVPPPPEVLASQPYWSFHRLGLERRRADTLRRACSRPARIADLARADPARAERVLTSLPGIGPWTAAEVGFRALGDADSVSVGDFHLPHLVARAFTGRRRGSDDLMLELLDPFRGHRGRVLRLLELGVPRPGRRAPRARVRSIADI